MVFAAASLKNDWMRLPHRFEEPHTVSASGSSQLARQVIADAPASLNQANTCGWMKLKKHDQSNGYRFDVTSNQLVIASNQKQTIQLNPQNLHDSLSGNGLPRL